VSSVAVGKLHVQLDLLSNRRCEPDGRVLIAGLRSWGLSAAKRETSVHRGETNF
jgi:hypothetical protein